SSISTPRPSLRGSSGWRDEIGSLRCDELPTADETDVVAELGRNELDPPRLHPEREARDRLAGHPEPPIPMRKPDASADDDALRVEDVHDRDTRHRKGIAGVGENRRGQRIARLGG